MPIADPKLRGLYGRLTGLKHSIPPTDTTTYETLGMDYNAIVESLMAFLKEDLNSFLLPRDAFYKSGSERELGYCYPSVFRSKVDQLIGHLNSVHFTDEGIVEIGSLYKVRG